MKHLRELEEVTKEIFGLETKILVKMDHDDLKKLSTTDALNVFLKDVLNFISLLNTDGRCTGWYHKGGDICMDFIINGSYTLEDFVSILKPMPGEYNTHEKFDRLTLTLDGRFMVFFYAGNKFWRN